MDDAGASHDGPDGRDRVALDATEPVLMPDLPIVDCHHHLRNDPQKPQYLFSEWLDDIRSGHRIVASVAIEDLQMFRVDGPVELRPVGETEFITRVATMLESGRYGSPYLCSGIVGYADLMLGDRVVPTLEAHVEAAPGRFKGIRVSAAWDECYMPERWKKKRVQATPGMLSDAAFRTGFGHLEKLGLSFDAHVFHRQLPELVDLSRAFPNVTIVANHCGGVLGLGSYASKRDAAVEHWKRGLKALARCENVYMKIGGLRWTGLPAPEAIAAADGKGPLSELLAAAWRPFVETCIEEFGSRRCMFESNFPPESEICGYRSLWNAFKRISDSCSRDERSALFGQTASRAYRLPMQWPGGEATAE